MSAEQMTAEQMIKDLLGAMEPCTFEQVVDELLEQLIGCTKANAVPIAVSALAALQQSGEICEYEQIWESGDSALEYAWQLSEEAIN